MSWHEDTPTALRIVTDLFVGALHALVYIAITALGIAWLAGPT